MAMTVHFFLDRDLGQTLNIKLILYIFEQLSGLKMIFHNSESSFLVKLRKLRINIGMCLSVNLY
jgi:hypothetical protein